MKNYGIRNFRMYERPSSNHTLMKTTMIAGVAIAVGIFFFSKFNMEVLDSTYAFENAVMANNGNTVVIPIEKWKDYKGEAVQLITDDNMAILSSSYMTSFIKGKAQKDLAEVYAKSITDANGDMSHYGTLNTKDNLINYQLIDFQFNFDKAIVIQNNRAVIIPVAKWKDFNGEQIQIITPENVVLLSSNYNTILVADSKSERKAIDLAQMLVGKDGVVTDFAHSYMNASFNKNLIDLKFVFNKSLHLGDESNCLFSLATWKDYDDGEQFQLNISDGPTFLCSSFNTILINDLNGNEVTGEAIAKALNPNFKAFTKDEKNTGKFYNKQFFDFDFSFQNALINSGNSGTILPLKNWNDYDGEQLQFVLTNGVTILSSSVDSSMSVNTNNEINVNTISKGLVSSESNSFNLDPSYRQNGYNKTMFDLTFNFSHALVINDNSILILSLDKWRDFGGSEQLKLTLPDKTVFMTTAYDTKLVSLGDSNISIQEVASWFNKNNKNIVDLSCESTPSLFNLKIFDNDLRFNYAIAVNGDVATIIPIDKWYDYDGDKNSDGDYTDYSEQLQITLNEIDKIYSDNTNIKLVYSDDIETVKKLASGHISKEGIVNIFSNKEKEYTK